MSPKAPKAYWQSVSFSSLRIKEWNGEFTVFQPGSGKTHFLNQMGMRILARLDDASLSADEISEVLAEQFQFAPDQNFSQQVKKILHRFDELGLIEKAGWESST